jgi:DNA-binding transcriptional ArsR family regulator
MKINLLDKVIHEPARLAILIQLAPADRVDYISLMRQTGLTWGNLSAHLARLEVAGYLTVEKEFRGRKPHTILSISETGRMALRNYLRQMRGLLDKLRE